MDQSRQTNKTLVEPAIPINQQVSFIQATCILVGIILGNSFSQWFYMLDIVIGLTLLVTSLTGECLVSKLFAKFPWNKTVYRSN